MHVGIVCIHKLKRHIFHNRNSTEMIYERLCFLYKAIISNIDLLLLLFNPLLSESNHRDIWFQHLISVSNVRLLYLISILYQSPKDQLLLPCHCGISYLRLKKCSRLIWLRCGDISGYTVFLLNEDWIFKVNKSYCSKISHKLPCLAIFGLIG